MYACKHDIRRLEDHIIKRQIKQPLKILTDHQDANIIIFSSTHSIVENEYRRIKGLKWPQA